MISAQLSPPSSIVHPQDLKCEFTEITLAENDIRVPHIHVIEILVIDRHCN